MRRILLAALLLGAPLSIARADNPQFGFSPDRWFYNWSRTYEFFGCSVGLQSCHTLIMEVGGINPFPSTVAETGISPNAYWSVFRWQATHQFDTPGFFTTGTLDVWSRYSGMSPLIDESLYPSLPLTSCIDENLPCSGAEVDNAGGLSGRFYGIFDVTFPRRAQLSVSYMPDAGGRAPSTEIVEMRLVPEPSTIALLASGILGLVATVRRRRIV